VLRDDFRIYRDVAAGVMLLPTVNSHGAVVIPGSSLFAKSPFHCDLRHTMLPGVSINR